MISVLIPVDRRGDSFYECIESLIAQTYEDTEFIFICDGTTDAEAVVARYGRRDSRIRRASLPASGPGAARNAGLDLAEGAFVAFCDSDDIMPRRALEHLHNKMRKGFADVVIGSFIEQFDSGNAVLCSVNNRGNGFERFFSYISIWNRLYRKDFLDRFALRFPVRRQGEDLLFLADVFLAKPKTAVIREIVYQWQRHETDRRATLTHSASLGDLLQLLESWNTFLDKMTPLYGDDVREHARAACPYLLDRIENIRDFDDREKALSALKPLLRRMGWEASPLRFAKLFRIRYENMMGGGVE
jgi:glycosyltransferase involved in cell wall biosynthesis